MLYNCLPKKMKNIKFFILCFFIVGTISLLLLNSCNRENNKEKEPDKNNITVTKEVFKDPGDWIMLDCYLSEGFNIKYADYESFPYYGENLTYVERCEVFDEEMFFTDWASIFSAFDGRTFKAHELAALKRYALWCGPAGFISSPIYQKLVDDEEILTTDLAKVYYANGAERQYRKYGNEKYSKKYAWVLMAVYDGFLTVNELSDAHVKTFKDLNLEDIYDEYGNPIFEIESKLFILQYDNGEKTTREVLGL